MASKNTKSLVSNLIPAKFETKSKVTIVGSGNVATAIAYGLLIQGVASDVVIVARNFDKVSGDLLDFQQGSLFFSKVRITGGPDVSLSAGSNLIIYAAGSREVEGRSRLVAAQKNVDIMRTTLPKLINFSPNATILIVSNPCDILAFVAWKLCRLPKNQIIGVGTHLETSQFRSQIGLKFEVSAKSVHGWVIGEHNESCIPVWSSVNVAGVRLQELNPQVGLEQDPEKWLDIHEKIINTEEEIFKLKRFSSWGIAMACVDLASSILGNTREVKTISTMVKGLHGISKEVFLSLPCVLSSSGVSGTVDLKLSDEEARKLRASSTLIDEIQKGLIF